jgi:iron(III) transport system permease protein
MAEAEPAIPESTDQLVERYFRAPLRRLRASGVTPFEVAMVVIMTVLVLWLVLAPVLNLFIGAFLSEPPGEGGEWTLENFKEVLGNPGYWLTVGRTLLVGFGVVALSTLIGSPLAWLVVKTDLAGKRWVELAAILPFFTSTFVGALAWILLGNPTNGMIKLWTGLPINVYSTSGIIWVSGIYMAPYMFLFTSAALRSVDTTYEEASFMSGAGLFRTLTRITFPVILPALLSGMTLVFVITMGIFGVAAILGFPARIVVLATDIFSKSAFAPPQYGQATVAALTLMAITAMCIVLQRRILRRGSYALVSGRGFRLKLYSLGKLTPFAYLMVSVYALLAVILPGLVLIKVSLQPYATPKFGPWTMENWQVFFTNPDLFDSFIRSMYLSTGGATLSVLMTAVIAYIIHRSKSPGRGVLEQVSVMPVGIPGIVMGLGMIWAYIQWPIWASVWILVVAYLTLFMPYGVRALGANVVQIHGELEESSRVHGGSWLQTFRRIVLPLLRPGIYSTWILLFIIFLREISTAVLLTTHETRVLPVLIFEQWTDGELNIMCTGALLLTMIMFVVISVFKWAFKVDVTPVYR